MTAEHETDTVEAARTQKGDMKHKSAEEPMNAINKTSANQASANNDAVATCTGAMFQKWEQQMLEAAKAFDPDDDGSTYKAYDNIRTRIKETPAQDLVGVMVKLRTVNDLAEGFINTEAQAIMDAAMEDVERLMHGEPQADEVAQLGRDLCRALTAEDKYDAISMQTKDVRKKCRANEMFALVEMGHAALEAKIALTATTTSEGAFYQALLAFSGVWSLFENEVPENCGHLARENYLRTKMCLHSVIDYLKSSSGIEDGNAARRAYVGTADGWHAELFQLLQETSYPEIPNNCRKDEEQQHLQSLGARLQGFQEDRTLHQQDDAE